MQRKPDETYLEDSGQAVACRRCGARMTIVLPMEVGSFARLLKAFATAHRWCEAPAPPEQADPYADDPGLRVAPL